MKVIHLEYSRPNSAVEWYATNASEPKSQDFLAMKSFVETHAQNVELLTPSSTSVSVSIYFADEKYAEYCQLYDAASTEINTYNSLHGITISRTDEDA